MKKIKFAITLTLVLLIFQQNYSKAEEKLMPFAAAVQIASTVSDGKLSVPEIVRLARQNNIKIVILTDRDMMKWEYGLWPLQNIIKKVVESNSIFKYGIKRYFKEIEEAQKANPDILLIPGIESAPFYCWEGSPFKNNLSLYNWHKHILVFGLNKLNDIENLPSVGNKCGLTEHFTWKNIYLFWPVAVLLTGVLFIRKREFNYKDEQGRRIGPYSKKWRIAGIFFIFFGLLFLINNFPFCFFKCSQYSEKDSITPYQNLIDYANQKGAATFWAHPEAEYVEKSGKVHIETREHTRDLLRSRDYTGFAIYYEGYEKVGRPGGIWDEILKEYCQGKRNKPIWAICALSFDQEGDLSAYMKDIQTVVLIPFLSEIEVLKALREGRMYVASGSSSLQFVLDKCVVRDTLDNSEKTIGEEISLKGMPQLEVSGHFLDGRIQPIKIKLIRNGVVIKDFEVNSPFNLTYLDEEAIKGQKNYYRLELSTDKAGVITNPIFVSFVQDN